MTNRREFISGGLASTLALASLPLSQAFLNFAQAASASPYTVPHTFGLGGVAIGNAVKVTSDEEARGALEAAWKSGERYFDTSPFYGFGLSEQRFGHFLDDKKREDYILSTKVGRVFYPSSNPRETMWKEPSKFDYKYDYSASGTRRSIEDSLMRLGIQSIDVVFIHDLSPDNKDLGKDWLKHFEVARQGAMKELSKMRSEGIIKGWGLGVNEIDPILKTLDVADPDTFLSANQYSMLKHEDALNRLFPVCEKRNIKLVLGTPLNAGCLAGRDRFNWDGKFPDEMKEKRKQMMEVCKNHKVDLRTAALQFALAPKVVSSIIPGARTKEQSAENANSMKVKIPEAFWKELKEKKLIAGNAPIPK